MIDFENKTVLVTGGGGGIGRTTVEKFATSGARVFVLESDEQSVADVEQWLTQHGTGHRVLRTDVTNDDEVNNTFEQIAREISSLDVLINNVGDSLQLVKPLEQYTDKEMDDLYYVNLRHVFQITRNAIPLLKQHTGTDASIVNISTIEAFRGIPNLAIYSAFKAGLTGFTKSLALELGQYKVRVNQVAPEATETPQLPLTDFIKPEYRDRLGDWVPLGRYGAPEDTANAVMYLSSEMASWVTGTTLHVDGGAMAAGGWYKTPQGGWTIAPAIETNGFNF